MAMHSLDELQPPDKALFSSILDTANLTASVSETDAIPDHTVRVYGIRTPNPASTIAPTPEPTPQTVYTALQKGDKGDEVKQLQQRLIELGYLDGNADGDFGNKTKAAVELFQSSAKLPVTGVADQETQQALYADNAPKAKVYKSLNFKELSRNPNQHIGEYYSFSGQVIQALESSNWNGTISVTLRIATKKWYDDGRGRSPRASSYTNCLLGRDDLFRLPWRHLPLKGKARLLQILPRHRRFLL